MLGRERLDSGMLVVEAAREVFSLSRRASAPVMAATGSIAATSPVETPVGSPSKGSSGGLTTSGPATLSAKARPQPAHAPKQHSRPLRTRSPDRGAGRASRRRPRGPAA